MIAHKTKTGNDMSDRQALIADLKTKKFPVLDDGWVRFLDVMGSDHDVASAARTSYQASTAIDEAEDFTKDRNLIRRLVRNRHTSPIEMAEIKVAFRVPMDCWRQIIRHRTASVNEYSTRFKPAIDSMATTSPSEWRLQATNNKQGSEGVLGRFLPAGEPGAPEYDSEFKAWSGPRFEDGFPAGGDEFTYAERQLHLHAQQVYRDRLAAGIAREQSRKDLPLSNYTEAIWKIDTHNLMHFLQLRMAADAQFEVREYANTICDGIFKPLFPILHEAFVDYRINAISLSRMEVDSLRGHIHSVITGKATQLYRNMSASEITEFHKKLDLLLTPPDTIAAPGLAPDVND